MVSKQHIRRLSRRRRGVQLCSRCGASRRRLKLTMQSASEFCYATTFPSNSQRWEWACKCRQLSTDNALEEQQSDRAGKRIREGCSGPQLALNCRWTRHTFRATTREMHAGIEDVGCSKPAGSRTHLTEEPRVDGPSARLEEHLRVLLFLLFSHGTARQTGGCCFALGTEQLLQEGRSNEGEVFKLVSDLLGLEKRTREEVVAAAASIRSGVDAQQRREWRGRLAREASVLCANRIVPCLLLSVEFSVDHWR
jgi:hypothetical protein